MRYSELIGLTVDQAQELAKSKGYTIRITQEDGINYAGTCDMDPFRLSVIVEKGIIVEPF